MPENDAIEEQDGSGQSAGPMISGKGWFVLGGVIIIEAVFFAVVLFMRQSDKKTDDHIGVVKGDTVDYMSKYNVTIKDFNQSVMSSGSQMLTLSMSLVIKLGRTPAEIRDEIKPSEDDMNKFKVAVETLENDVRGKLVEKVNTMNYTALNKPEGKRMIASAVKDFLNDKLKSIDLQLDETELDRNRVLDVTITQFFLQ